MTNHTQHQQHQHQHQWQPAHDNGHWKGHDAYPPHHNSNQHDQGHWQAAAPVRDTNSNTVQPGESTILPIQYDAGQYQGHHGRWQQDEPAQMRDEQGIVLQPGEFSTLPLPQMRDEHGNVLQPGEFSTLPVPNQFADQHAWHASAGGHAQQDAEAGGHIVHHGADFFVTPDGQIGGASSVSWEPAAAATPDVGGEFHVMSSIMG